MVGLSAGLIGPEGTDRKYNGSLEGTQVFLGCSDIDPHIPKERVHESAQVFEPHTINEDELKTVRTMMLSTI